MKGGLIGFQEKSRTRATVVFKIALHCSSFSYDVMATILMDLNKQMAALLVDQIGLRGIGHLHNSVILLSGPECNVKVLSYSKLSSLLGIETLEKK